MTRHHVFLSVILVFIATAVSAAPPAEPLPSFPLEDRTENSLNHQWAAKKVHDSQLIDDMEQQADWLSSGIAQMSYTDERAHDGRRSLRFRTSLRDEGHLSRSHNAQGVLVADIGGWCSIMRRFAQPQDWSAYNRLSFWVYVHPTSMQTYSFNVMFDCEGATADATSPVAEHVVHDLKPGEWNHIIWEFPNLRRDKVRSMSIGQNLRGYEPEDEGIVTYDIDQLEVQRVDADTFEGWRVSPGKIALNHVGYRPQDSKVAMAGEGAGDQFEVVVADTKATVLKKPVTQTSNKHGAFCLLDFSELKTAGEYLLRTGTIESHPFRIADDIWRRPTYKALNFFFCERCGYEVPGIHHRCHQDWQGVHNGVTKVINGGWHDAGDMSQGTWRTAMGVYAMLDLVKQRELQQHDPALRDRVMEEAQWGLDWLLKTQFGDGYRMSWSTMRFYTDNQIGTVDDIVSPAQNVPWENFLTAAVEALASELLKKDQPEPAKRCLAAAKDDWQAAVQARAEWSYASCVDASWGAISSIHLYQATGEQQYADRAVEFGRLLLRCQEQGFLKGLPISGFFYTDTNRGSIVHNHHAAFDESPLLALAALCDAFPQRPEWIEWYAAAVLNAEYFLKPGSQIAAPYDLLPNSVWRKDEILGVGDPAQRASMLRQWQEGTVLGDEFALRTFPIWHDRCFHGNTNVHLSGTLALAAATRLRGDSGGERLVGKQLQWIFGGNPFGQSLMYGEGYDYAPLFAYCLKNVVGALPVGMDSMRNDEPYWSGTNYATYKEIWTAPTERFLWLMAYYPLPDVAEVAQASADAKAAVRLEARMQAADEANASVTVEVTAKGAGAHDIAYRAFNAEVVEPAQHIDLTDGRPATVRANVRIKDPTKPWVVVVVADGDRRTQQEVFGPIARPLP